MPIITNPDGPVFGTPKQPFKFEVIATPIRGLVQQAYGIYVVPSFQQLITVQRQDPLLNEATSMMAEQIMGSDFYITGDGKYALIEKCINYIKDWNEKNDIREKMLDGAGQLYGMGNWIVVLDSKFGFTIVPLEAIWHAVPVGTSPLELNKTSNNMESDPLQEAYDLELHPTYQLEGSTKILHWGEFYHFRKNVLGAGWQYSSSNPFGLGFIYGMLACPVDSKGNVSPSYLDIRYGLRTASFVATMKFAVGTMYIGFPNMSNEDFEGQKVVETIQKMSPYGGKFVTNTDVKTDLALPAKSESYQPWIDQMENEINAVMAVPSIGMGSKEGSYSKSTAFTREKIFEFKVDAYRRVLASGMEKIWSAVLDHAFGEGTGDKAKISLQFGKNSGDYTLEGVIAMVGAGIMDAEQAQYVLTKYFKYEFNPARVPKPVVQQAGASIAKPQTKTPLSLKDAATTATDYAEKVKE
jgi:hypothetical protein